MNMDRLKDMVRWPWTTEEHSDALTLAYCFNSGPDIIALDPKEYEDGNWDEIKQQAVAQDWYPEEAR